MRISIQASSFKIDTRRLNGRILDSTRRAMLNAVEDFLLAAAPAVPIQTGMARGSFLNMLHLLESQGLGAVKSKVDVPDQPRKVKKDGSPLIYRHSGGGKYPKTPHTAMKFSTPMAQVLKKVGNSIVFNYKSDVVHYDKNDERRNWYSFRRGSNAFMNRMRKFKPIDVSEYVLKVSYTTGTHATGYNNETVTKVVK